MLPRLSVSVRVVTMAMFSNLTLCGSPITWYAAQPLICQHKINGRGKRGHGWRWTIVIGCMRWLPPGGAGGNVGVGPDKPSSSQARPSPQPSRRYGQHRAGQYYDCAIVRQDGLTSKALPLRGDDDTTCAGKAILVIDGNNVTVRNLTLQRAGCRTTMARHTRRRRQPDHRDVKFLNNEEGILAADNPNATIRITAASSSITARAKAAVRTRLCRQIHLLHVDHSRFFDTQHTHNIKSRAAATEVIDCDIQDGRRVRRAFRSTYRLGLADRGGSTLEKARTREPRVRDHHRRGSVRQATDKILIRNNTSPTTTST